MRVGLADNGSEQKRARFEAVALPLMTALYNVAVRLTGSAEDAADVTQDTLLRAYRTFENFRPDTNARAWLFTILYSVIINRQKKLKREERNLRLDEPWERFSLYLDASDRSDFANEAVTTSDLRSPDVENALQSLPASFRTAVILVDVEELSYEEAAVVMNCPVGTLRSRLFRGRRLLFDALYEYARRTGFLKSRD